MQWHKYGDDDFMDQVVHWYGEFRASTHPLGHGIMVYSRIERDHDYRGSGRTRIRHTAQVSCGPYGENVREYLLPPKTTIHKARAKALEMAERAASEGLLSGFSAITA